MNKTAAVYVRVSTDNGSQDTSMQLNEILNWLKANNISDHVVYEDKGYSGTKTNRPALKRLMTDVRAGKIDRVICWKMDRFFRSLKDLLDTLREFESRGIVFVALRDSVDMNSATGKLMMHVIGAFAEFEASVIRERVMAGLVNAKAKGKTLGRRHAVTHEAIEPYLNASTPIKDIAKHLKVSTKTISRMIKTLER